VHARADVPLKSELSFVNSMGAARDNYKELTEFLAEFRSIGFDTMENLMEEKGGSGAAVKP